MSLSKIDFCLYSLRCMYVQVSNNTLSSDFYDLIYVTALA